MRQVFLLINLIGSIVIGFWLCCINVERVPGGYELGVLGFMFLSMAVSAAIYFVFASVSIAFSVSKIKYNYLIQLLSMILCSVSIYVATYIICVENTRQATPEEEELRIKKIVENLETLYDKIPTIIDKGTVFRPNATIVKNDSLMVLDYLKSKLCVPHETMDSTHRVIVNSYLKYSQEYFMSDENTEKINQGISHICESLKIRNLFYSPDHEVVVIIFSNNEMASLGRGDPDFQVGSSLAFIGVKDKGILSLYFYCGSDFSPRYISNDNLAYARTFKDIIGKGNYDYKYTNMLDKTFWKKKTMQKTYKSNNELFYGFEGKINKELNEFTKQEPAFLISY